ncbi:MAG: hypothetical protein ACHQQR_16835, partial [Gemmatimonadales bacterium]
MKSRAGAAGIAIETPKPKRSHASRGACILQAVTSNLAMQAPPDTTAILVIFVLTYAGIAVGHVPGLRLNRTGIA